MLSFTEGKQIAKEMFVLGTYEDFPIGKILEVLTAADELYFNDDDVFLEDSQYDALKQYARRLAPTDVYFTGVGSAVRGGKIALPYQMGSLDQVYQGDYAKWVADNDLSGESIVVSDKLDGASVMIVYGTDGKLQIGYSRGDGTMGADITRHVKRIHNVPQRIDNGGEPLTVRAENIIAPANFAVINTGAFARGGRIYKNCRNMVSGLMNSSENHPEVYKIIDTISYEIVGSKLSKLDQLKKLKALGFSVVAYSVKNAADCNDERLTQILNVRRKASPYEIDGIVLDVDSANTRAKLNDGSLNPPYARKFKVADASNLAIATVKGVEWNISKDGYLKPRVQIHPVDLVGVTIQNLTGFNAKFILDNKIGPNAKIKITRSGDVIPFILETVEPAPGGADMPDEDAEWTATGIDLIITDVSNNETAKFARLGDFFSSIDAPHLGDGNLMKMFEMGFDTPEKIITLSQQDVCNLVGSTPIGKKIFAGLCEKLTNIPMYALMGSHHAFGRGVGVRKMKKLWEAYQGDMSVCESISKIVAVEGFEEKTARKIQAGYPEFLRFLQQIEGCYTIAPYVAKKQGHLTGKTFIFTGFRSSELEKQIVDAGGSMCSSVSSKTSFLVTAEPNSTSGKAKAARDKGVAVISQEQLKAMLNS